MDTPRVVQLQKGLGNHREIQEGVHRGCVHMGLEDILGEGVAGVGFVEVVGERGWGRELERVQGWELELRRVQVRGQPPVQLELVPVVVQLRPM